MSAVTELASNHRLIRLVEDILERRSARRCVAADDDLREIGLTSLELVNLMLAVEAEFSLEIPDHAMTPANFRSVTAIEALVTSLRQDHQ